MVCAGSYKELILGNYLQIWIYSHYRIPPAKGSYNSFTQSSRKASANSPGRPQPMLYRGSWITGPELPGAVLVLSYVGGDLGDYPSFTLTQEESCTTAPNGKLT